MSWFIALVTNEIDVINYMITAQLCSVIFDIISYFCGFLVISLFWFVPYLDLIFCSVVLCQILVPTITSSTQLYGFIEETLQWQ